MRKIWREIESERGRGQELNISLISDEVWLCRCCNVSIWFVSVTPFSFLLSNRSQHKWLFAQKKRTAYGDIQMHKVDSSVFISWLNRFYFIAYYFGVFNGARISAAYTYTKSKIVHIWMFAFGNVFTWKWFYRCWITQFIWIQDKNRKLHYLRQRLERNKNSAGFAFAFGIVWKCKEECTTRIKIILLKLSHL